MILSRCDPISFQSVDNVARNELGEYINLKVNKGDGAIDRRSGKAKKVCTEEKVIVLLSIWIILVLLLAQCVYLSIILMIACFFALLPTPGH
jgi:hypothetical protein